MYILASKSPRRKELMKKITSDFSICVADIDESISYSLPTPLESTMDIAKRKGEIIVKHHKDDIVISADTIVVLDNEILGKPKDEDDAYRMLKRESGKKQIVISGYTYIGKGVEVNRSVATEVHFNELTDEEIWSYIKKYQPLDKAGSYGIQDEAGLIKSIVGSYDNVMGFPTEDIKIHVFNRYYQK